MNFRSSTETSSSKMVLSTRLNFEWWSAALILVVSVYSLVRFTPLTSLDNLIYDAFIRNGFATNTTATKRIAIVAVDDTSLAAVGPWPWSRSEQASLMEAIIQARPASIRVNILLPENGDLDGNARLAEVIKSSKIPVYLAAATGEQSGSGQAASRAVLPATILSDAASGVGHSNLIVDPDGLVRRFKDTTIPPSKSADNEPGPSELYFGQKKSSTAATQADENALSSLSSSILGSSWRHSNARSAAPPIAELIAYDPNSPYTIVPASSLITGEVSGEILEGRHVILGVTATGEDTRFPTPLAQAQGYLAGSEVLAHILASHLDGRSITVASPLTQSMVSITFVMLLLLAARRTRSGQTLAATALLAMALLFVSWATLAIAHYWLPPTAGMAGLLTVHPLWSWRRITAVLSYMNAEISELDAAGDTRSLVLRAGGTSATEARPRHSHNDFDLLVSRATQLAAAIDRVKAMRAFLTDVVDHLPAAAFVISTNGDIVLENSAATKLLETFDQHGAPRTNLTHILAPLRLDSLVDPSLRATSRRDGEPMTCSAKTPDGRTLELVFVPLRNDKRSLGAWIFQLIDVTDLTVALREGREAVNSITHDMRSPISSILATVRQMSRTPNNDAITRIERYAQRAINLAETFTAMARANSSALQREQLSLRLLVEDVIDEHRPRAEEIGIRIELTGEIEPWLVSGDLGLLERAVGNLIDNALKYGASGKRIECRIENGEYRFENEDPSRPAVLISVRDWGGGLPEGASKFVFDQYWQGSSSKSGAGLGLAFVKRVVEAHGGTCLCNSSQGEGTKFVIVLPALVA